MSDEVKVSRRRRGLVMVGALALGLASALGTARPASAAPSTPSFGNIDFTKTGSIIFHKHQEPAASTPASPDGSNDANITTPGVANVVFTAYPISSLNLQQQASWTTLSTLSVPSDACTSGTGGTPSLSGQTLGTGLPAPATDSAGASTLGSLPLAAYLVCETSSPSTVVDKAQPFVVTVPFPDTASNGGTTNGWLYDVNVYPKNGVATITKSITSQTTLGLGATASFPVTTDIPAIASNASFDHYNVTDPLDSRLTNPAVASVTVGGTAVDSSYYTTSVANNYAWVSFTQAGLTWLKTQGGKQLVTTFTGTVSSLGNGVINNTAYLDISTDVQPNPPTNPPTPPTTPPTTPPGTPSNKVNQNWGEVKINKVDAGNGTTGLQGATFQVYAAAAPNATTCSNAIASGATPITVNGSTTFTSNASGTVDIAGLFVSDDVNAPINATQRCYVVQETQAPAGYVTPTGSAALTAVTVVAGAATTVGAGNYPTVSNSKEIVPGLPLTGGQGTMLASILGGLLIAGGAGGAAVSRKRRKQEQNA